MSPTLEDFTVPAPRVDCSHHENDLLARRACRALEASPYFHGRVASLSLHAEGDKIAVKGRVPSFFLKQVLQTLLAQVEGVRQVENRIEVTPPQGVA